MRGILVFLVALLAACAVADFPTYPLDVLTYLDSPVNITGWVPCYVLTSQSTAQFPINELDARCPGPVRYVVAQQAGDTIHLISMGTNLTTFMNNGTSGSVRFFSTPTTFGFTNESTIPTSCVAITGTSRPVFCRRVLNNTFIPGMYAPGVGYIANSVSVVMTVLYNPSANKNVSDSCTTPLGLCSVNNTVQANGTCSGGTLLTPPPDDPCVSSWSCNEATGTFTPNYRAIGASCNGTDVCGLTFTCNATYQCVIATEKQCISTNPCEEIVGTCNVTLGGNCTFTKKANGTSCSDGTSCTSNDYCNNDGQCVGTNTTAPAKTCGVPSYCDFTSGQWVYTDEITGTSCVPDNVCVSSTVLGSSFECQPGQLCQPQVSTNCSALPLQKCYQPAVCSNQFQNCTYNPEAVGTACDDDNPCTQGSTCDTLHNCALGTPTIGQCPTTTESCKRYVPTVIDPVTCACVLTDLPNNRSCSVAGALCVVDATCQNGTCIGNARTCPGDACNAPTACSNTTGCLNPAFDGDPCNRTCFIDSFCDSGFCIEGEYQADQPGCAFGSSCGPRWALGAANRRDIFDGLFDIYGKIIGNNIGYAKNGRRHGKKREHRTEISMEVIGAA